MYKLNEFLKRLEPSETLCQFCETEHSTDMEDNYFIPLYKENDSTNIVVYGSVKFKKVPVGIPRCKTCKAVHESANSKALLYAWGGAILLVIFSFAILGPVLGVVSIFVALFGGIFANRHLYEKWVAQKGIYTEVDGAKQNEAVQELVISGWSLTQPMA
jgi:hypothetical protein